jgi:integrase/recombinase XerD
MNRLILQFSADLHLQRYAENSVQNHRLDMLRFQDWLDARNRGAEEEVARLTSADLTEYQGHLAKRLKPRSVARHLSSLRLFFRFMESAGLLAANPMESVTFPRFWSDLPNLLTAGEVAALIDAPEESHYLGLRDRAMLELLYSSGLKLHELIALNVDALQLELGFVRVAGRRERMVPLTPRCVEILARYLAESRPKRVLYAEEPCLFPGRNGTRITRIAVWKLIKKYAQQAGIQKNFNARTLRHAFAMHLILGGMDLDAIQLLFGYKSLEATSLYAHVNQPDFQATYHERHPLAAERRAEAVRPEPEPA